MLQHCKVTHLNSFTLNEEDLFQTKLSNAAAEPSNSSSLVTISLNLQKTICSGAHDQSNTITENGRHKK